MKLLSCLTAVAMLSTSTSVYAWDGYDYEADTSVEIEKGNLVREGEEIEFYDYRAGEYRIGQVESVNRSGRSVEVEVLDNESGEIRILEMDE